MLQPYKPEGVAFTSVTLQLKFVADEEPYGSVALIDARVRKLKKMFNDYNPDKEALLFVCDSGQAYNHGTLMLPVVRPLWH